MHRRAWRTVQRGGRQVAENALDSIAGEPPTWIRALTCFSSLQVRALGENSVDQTQPPRRSSWTRVCSS